MRFLNYLKLFFLFTIILNACKYGVSERVGFDKMEFPQLFGDTLIIVLDLSDSLSYSRHEIINGEKYIYFRKYFVESPNLIVNLGHDPSFGKGTISKNKILNLPIVYDSILNFNDWGSLDYETYYLIEKDQLLNNKSKSVDFVEIKMTVKGEI